MLFKWPIHCSCYVRIFLKHHFRHADQVSINNEVIVSENGQLKEAKVKVISSILMEGNTF